MEYVKKRGVRLFVAAGQLQGGGCIWKFKGGKAPPPPHPKYTPAPKNPGDACVVCKVYIVRKVGGDWMRVNFFEGMVVHCPTYILCRAGHLY